VEKFVRVNLDCCLIQESTKYRMKKISVITPSIRKEGLKLVSKALKKQTFRDFDWWVGAPFPPLEEINYDYWILDDFKGGFWSLNRIYNKLIEHSRGELIVSWQDYTYAKPDALEKFWFHYQNNPRAIVTGVGNKYKDESWQVKIWQDPRERNDQGSFYECYPNDIEFNFCAVPREAFYQIGGFDEKMDFLGYGMDGISVVERLDALGWKFYIDQTNKSYSLKHGRPKGWEKYNLLHGGYIKRKKQLIEKGKWPVLDYLK